MGRIAVAATAPFGADVLERLAARHDIVLLLTRPDKPRGRGRKLAPRRALDAGPIAAQEAFDVGPEDDAGAVYARAAEVAARLLDDVLAVPSPEFHPQPAEGVTYAEKLTPEDRELDLTRPAHELVNRVRALSPHVGARAVVDGRPLIVWKAREAPDGSLELLEVQPEGGRRMDYDAYRRGLRP